MTTIVGLVFVLIGLLWTIDCFFPTWRATPPTWAFTFAIGALIRWLIGLIIIYIVYLIVLAVLALVHIPGLG